MAHCNRAIITNYDALVTKYGADGALKIWNAIIDFSKGRGGGDGVMNLAYAGKGFVAVTDPKNPKQNKQSIDAIHKFLENPNYLVIVGASDVVPFQDLKNTMQSDGDAHAWGDLPYACEAPYSRDPATFRSPTRVVGRIPDLVGGTDPNYLIKILKASAKAKPRPAGDYVGYLGVTADVWKDSTELSVQNIFGSNDKLQLSPTKGPKWSKTLLGSRAHFINCHGAEADTFFYGQAGHNYPQAHSAAYIDGKIAPGSVAAAECCYGAELYDPALSGGQAGICQTYLSSGGYGFFGSSTIAYGPASGNGAADLITQYFMKHVLAGASLGRATLMARQEYIAQEASGSGALDPVALKTLAEFYLLGDPSIHPVEKTETSSKAGDAALMKGLPKSLMSFDDARLQRRQGLIRTGKALEDSVAYSRPSKSIKVGNDIQKALTQIAKNMNMTDPEIRSHTVVGGNLAKSAFRPTVPKRVFHVVQGQVGTPQEKFTPAAAVVAEEQAGKIVALRSYDRK